MIRKFRPLFMALCTLILVIGGVAFFSQSASAASNGWLVKCFHSHDNLDDPIKFPNQQGLSHQHEYFGNTTTQYNSTYASMIAGSTNCGTVADTSGYWFPSLQRNGVTYNAAGSYGGRATRQEFYYRENNISSSYHIEAFPPNFGMIQGYAAATSVADANAHGAKIGSEIYWGCSDNSEPGKMTAPIDCPIGIITLHIQFPNCWDGFMPPPGAPIDMIGTGHVKYPSSSTCPVGYGHALPRLIERTEYPVGTSSSGITLGNMGMQTYGAHADFWNTWQQAGLQGLVDRCLNGNIDCGTDPVAPTGPAATVAPATSSAVVTSSAPATSSAPVTSGAPVTTSVAPSPSPSVSTSGCG
jgi:hypothetical protein